MRWGGSIKMQPIAIPAAKFGHPVGSTLLITCEIYNNLNRVKFSDMFVPSSLRRNKTHTSAFGDFAPYRWPFSVIAVISDPRGFALTLDFGRNPCSNVAFPNQKAIKLHISLSFVYTRSGPEPSPKKKKKKLHVRSSENLERDGRFEILLRFLIRL